MKCNNKTKVEKVEKVWGAPYTLGARYLSKNAVLVLILFFLYLHAPSDVFRLGTLAKILYPFLILQSWHACSEQ